VFDHLFERKTTMKSLRYACLYLLVLTSPFLVGVGCLPAPANPGDSGSGIRGPVDLNLGQASSGSLGGGQTLEGLAPVSANHVYRLVADIKPKGVMGTVGLDATITVSGDPLSAPVTQTVGVFSGTPSSNPYGDASPQFFQPLSDGTVTVEIVNNSKGFIEGMGAGGVFNLFDRLMGDTSIVTYTITLTDQGLDDNGSSPATAVALPVGPEVAGTIMEGEEGDYFRLNVTAGTTYLLTVQATGPLTVDSGVLDVFGQTNFGVYSPGGVGINGYVDAGQPGTATFTDTLNETLTIRLKSQCYDSSYYGGSSTCTYPIQYRISCVVSP
jgi:hypothetical protein